MIVASGIELRAGADLLVSADNLKVQSGDRIGLVGRNGAGKTTLMRTLAGERAPDQGHVSNSGSIGYLPQDPRSAEAEELARDRILGSRGLPEVTRRLAKRTLEMSQATEGTDDWHRAASRYSRAESEFLALGGYAAESEAAAISAYVGLPQRVLDSPLEIGRAHV